MAWAGGRWANCGQGCATKSAGARYYIGTEVVQNGTKQARLVFEALVNGTAFFSVDFCSRVNRDRKKGGRVLLPLCRSFFFFFP